MRLAIDGLVSFSNYPLRLVTYLGIGTACLGAVLMVWGLVDALYRHTGPPGWASTIVVVLFMGSIQLVSLGIIGEYIRLIFLESKRRPSYIVAAVRSTARSGTRRPMIETLSRGRADDNMAEDILLDLEEIVRRHPWWRARSRLTLDLLADLGVRAPRACWTPVVVGA